MWLQSTISWQVTTLFQLSPLCGNISYPSYYLIYLSVSSKLFLSTSDEAGNCRKNTVCGNKNLPTAFFLLLQRNIILIYQKSSTVENDFVPCHTTDNFVDWLPDPLQQRLNSFTMFFVRCNPPFTSTIFISFHGHNWRIELLSSHSSSFGTPNFHPLYASGKYLYWRIIFRNDDNEKFRTEKFFSEYNDYLFKSECSMIVLDSLKINKTAWCWRTNRLQIDK